MRALADIDADLAACRMRLNELMIEREDVRRAEIDTIRAMFLAGKHRRDIARELGMTPAAVQGLLYREGLTDAARDQIRARGSAAGRDSGACGRPRLRRGGGSDDFSNFSLASQLQLGGDLRREGSERLPCLVGHADQHGGLHGRKAVKVCRG